ncbi:unnamed protein product [Clonostachys rhizophaga]|uniref:3-beta hydroxysteroid dehydrogenase/isomerase domain-containing protein n=1 Tax=Clonostachys rhizophaga TaxID=160324 RepID=A0A9N9VMJ2_9HYPO|nr:unnamed protein product [Clonostachys rhizophaga]
MDSGDAARLALAACGILSVLAIAYLVRLNIMLKGTPAEARGIVTPWTEELRRKAYKELENNPVDWTADLPPKLDRRYIITGGNGLVGGYIVLQLLARGTSPESIRILDIRETERSDLSIGPAAQVEFIKTDITSPESLDAAFSKPWSKSVAHLPLTVFHTAAVIVVSERIKLFYRLPEAVNIHGTRNVLDAARKAGADIFSATSSGSIAIRPISVWDSWWRSQPRDYLQFIDESDFDKPMRAHEEYFGNYAVSKADAERMVCGENEESFRTGCIRPTNAVYGQQGDACFGRLLSLPVIQTWIPHVIQNFVHGANVAEGHLRQEAVLARKGDCPQAGRPFIVTDPNPPITFADLYGTITTLSVHPTKLQLIQPVIILVLSHILEWYSQLPYRLPFLKPILPEMKGDIKTLRPGLFSVCTHVIASDARARKPVAEGGLGYRGTFTTLQGMVTEVIEWNQEHSDKEKARRVYSTSILLADKLEKVHGS